MFIGRILLTAAALTLTAFCLSSCRSQPTVCVSEQSLKNMIFETMEDVGKEQNIKNSTKAEMLCFVILNSNDVSLLDFTSYMQSAGIEYYSISPRICMVNNCLRHNIKMFNSDEAYKVYFDNLNSDYLSRGDINRISVLYQCPPEEFTQRVHELMDINASIYKLNCFYYSAVEAMRHRKLFVDISDDVIEAIRRTANMQNKDTLAAFPAIWGRYLVSSGHEAELEMYLDNLISELAAIKFVENDIKCQMMMHMYNCALFNCSTNNKQLETIAEHTSAALSGHQNIMKWLGIFYYLREAGGTEAETVAETLIIPTDPAVEAEEKDADKADNPVEKTAVQPAGKTTDKTAGTTDKK